VKVRGEGEGRVKVRGEGEGRVKVRGEGEGKGKVRGEGEGMVRGEEGKGFVSFEKDPYKAAKEADAVLLMTDWGEYPALDWKKIYGSMRKPALVFDTRNCLDTAALKKIGFNVLNIGK